MSFFCPQVVLELPLRNNDSLWNEQFVIISECEPRTSIYLFCVLAVPILIMVFAFQWRTGSCLAGVRFTAFRYCKTSNTLTRLVYVNPIYVNYDRIITKVYFVGLFTKSFLNFNRIIFYLYLFIYLYPPDCANNNNYIRFPMIWECKLVTWIIFEG